MIPTAVNPMGLNRVQSPYFELTVKPVAGSLTYGFVPTFWTSTGHCEVVDWGDGTGGVATTGQTLLTHTYAEAGTYHIKIDAECYRIRFGNNATYAPLVYSCNRNFAALGTLTDAGSMFLGCSNALLYNIALPDSVTSMIACFPGVLGVSMKKLPNEITNIYNCFRDCPNAIIDISELAANAPAGGYKITNISYAFTSSPGVTGSRSAFLAACPLVTSSTDAFTGTNTTA